MRIFHLLFKLNNSTNSAVVFQDFGRLLMDGSLAANSVSSNDLVSWKLRERWASSSKELPPRIKRTFRDFKATERINENFFLSPYSLVFFSVGLF
jgi:hypothetical protein